MSRSLVLGLIFLVACSNKLDGAEDSGPDEETDLPPETDLPVDTADTGPFEDDADGDGYTESDGDCDDSDEHIHPNAPERCNGIDDDCDGHDESEDDLDGDGTADCDDACPIRVDASASGSGSGSVTDPFTSIQDAIDAAASLSCDEIAVAAGTYDESIDFLGQDLELRSDDGAARTWISGDGSGPVVTFADGETDAALIEGFTITAGGGEQGGGIYIAGADPQILNNDISGNVMDAGLLQGGGIYMVDSYSEISGNTISGNDAGYGGTEEGCDGGGIFVRNGGPTIIDNWFEGNSAGDGGAMWFAYSDSLVANNTIVLNLAYDVDPDEGGQGGGVNVQIGTADFYMAGNLVAQNTANTHGGGIVVYEYNATWGNATVANNTIVWNSVTDTTNGGGLAGWSLTSPVFTNNIVAWNYGSGVYLNDTTLFGYNDVFGNDVDYVGDQGDLTAVGGNISVDPKFVSISDDGDFTNDDFRLQGSSTLVNAGDSAIRDADGTRSDIGMTGGPYGM